MVVILFANIQSAASTENVIYIKNGFSLEHPAQWDVKDNWNKYQKNVFFQVDLQNNSGITIKYQKSTIPIDTINGNLLQLIIENERQNCRLNKEGPCWEFEFTSAKTIVIDGTKSISLEYQATLNGVDTVIKKIFIPEGEDIWLISIKIPKDKSELFEDVEKSIMTFSRNNKTVNESNIANLTDGKIPEWVKNSMKWYVEGAISEKEMIMVLEFLIEQGIIKVSIIQ